MHRELAQRILLEYATQEEERAQLRKEDKVTFDGGVPSPPPDAHRTERPVGQVEDDDADSNISPVKLGNPPMA